MQKAPFYMQNTPPLKDSNIDGKADSPSFSAIGTCNSEKQLHRSREGTPIKKICPVAGVW
jgi:hypothetical protein